MCGVVNKMVAASSRFFSVHKEDLDSLMVD